MVTLSYLFILDLDGTLVDSLDDLTTSVNVVRRHFSLPSLDRGIVQGFIGQGARSLVEKALPGCTLVEINTGLKIFLAHNEAHLFDRTILYDGVASTLAALSRQGHILALLSNKNEELCRKLLIHFGISDHFSAIMGGNSAIGRKPSPEPVIYLMSLLKHPPQKTFMVGDSINDVAAARNAGVFAVGCTYGYGGSSELSGAVVCIDSFSELLQLPLTDIS